MSFFDKTDGARVLNFGTVGTNAIGTLIAAPGSGNRIFIAGYVLNVSSGTLDLCLSYGLGSNGNSVVCRGVFLPGGGVSKNLYSPTSGGTTNAALTYQILSGAGTAYWNIEYWTEV